MPPSNLGDLYHYYLKDFAQAEMYLKQAIANEPANAFLYKNLADLYTLSYKEKAHLAEGVMAEYRRLTESQSNQ